jgi:hypothetical protein
VTVIVLRGALAMTLALLVLGACSDYPPRTEFEPGTVTSDPNVERLLAQLEQAINEKNPFGVCARYAAAAPRCDDIWRKRLRTWTVPVELSLDKITFGCAGDSRVSFLEKTRLGHRRRTLTVITLTEGADDYAIIDIAVGNRLSSLVIPRYGDCANFDDGSAGAPNLDEAGSGGQGNNR